MKNTKSHWVLIALIIISSFALGQSPAPAGQLVDGTENAQIVIDPVLDTPAPAGPRWYISNGSGMLLEETYKTRAMREKYSVMAQTIRPENTPAELRKYYSAPWTIECRILYEDGNRLRTQWVFLDTGKSALLTAAISNDGSGFIEWYNDRGFVQEEQRLAADGSGYFVSYTYRDYFLLKAEAVAVAPVKTIEKKEVKKAEVKAELEPALETTEAAVDAEASSAENTALEQDGTAAVNNAEASNAVEDEAVKDAVTAEKSTIAKQTAIEQPDVKQPAVKQTAVTQTEAGEQAATGEQAAAVEQAASEQKEPPAEPPPVPPKPRSETVRNPEGPAKFPEFFVAATGKEGEKLWTDNYRYTRAGTLRAIERVYHSPGVEEKFSRVIFPRTAYEITPSTALDAKKEDGAESVPQKKEFVTPGTSVKSDFLNDIYNVGAVKVKYNTDSKRRVLSELRYDSEDNLLGELVNIWEGDRISKVTWKSNKKSGSAPSGDPSGDISDAVSISTAGGSSAAVSEERVIEFTYNKSGERTGERDYRNGTLERTVTIEKEREIEELYLLGKPALRAVWQDGKKISEERLLNRKRYE